MKLKIVVALALVAALSVVADAQLASRTADEWIKTLDSPQRIAGLKIDEIVGKLQIKPGQAVADIGAGSGAFEGALSAAVSPKGTVYAVDIEQGLLDHIAQRAKDLNVTNVRTVLGKFSDPNLPVNNIDLAMINDVLHHIQDRAGYLKSLAGYIKPGGRIAVIDFYPERGSHRDQPELQVTKAQVAAWMAAAGLKPSEEFDLFPDKYFVVYSK